MHAAKAERKRDGSNCRSRWQWRQGHSRKRDARGGGVNTCCYRQAQQNPTAGSCGGRLIFRTRRKTFPQKLCAQRAQYHARDPVIISGDQSHKGSAGDPAEQRGYSLGRTKRSGDGEGMLMRSVGCVRCLKGRALTQRGGKGVGGEGKPQRRRRCQLLRGQRFSSSTMLCMPYTSTSASSTIVEATVTVRFRRPS